MTDGTAKAVEALEAMREIELLVADLYRRFAEAFPDDGALWRELVGEEEDHAATVAALKDIVGRCGGRVAPAKVNLATLVTFRKGLKDQLGRLAKGGIGRQAALFIARDLEKTLIEHEFFDVVACDDPEFRSARDRVQHDTKSHLQRLEEHIGTLSR